MAKKVIKYHLKKDVRDDLDSLFLKIGNLLYYDSNDGFDFIPHYSVLPTLFKVFSHLLWNRTYDSWFKKVYE